VVRTNVVQSDGQAMAQVPTSPTTASAIMRSRDFKQGVAEVRAGRPPDYDAASRPPRDSWHYERGRAWGTAAPKDMPIMIGRRVNPKAVRIFWRSVL
jgi:hypothetical protein